MSAFRGASGSPFGGGMRRDDGLEDVGDPDAFLGRGQNGLARVEPDDLLDLPAGLLGLRAGQIDLVDDRDDVEVVVDREIRVGERLRLDALRGVDEQQRAFARRQRAGHLVREVDVPGRVDEVQDIRLPVPGDVAEAHGMRLDGDPALALEVHGVEHLRFHLARLQRSRHLQEAIREGRLPVVDVGDDGEIPDEALIHRRTIEYIAAR